MVLLRKSAAAPAAESLAPPPGSAAEAAADGIAEGVEPLAEAIAARWEQLPATETEAVDPADAKPFTPEPNPHADLPAGDVVVGDAEPPAATTTTTPPNIDPAKAERDADFAKECASRVTLIRRREREYEDAKKAAKDAKDELDEAHNDLAAFVENYQKGQGTLFDQPGGGAGGGVGGASSAFDPADPAALDAAAMAANPDRPVPIADDAWRSAPVSELDGLTDTMIEKLAEHSPPLRTVGEIADFTAGGGLLNYVKGIGKAKAEKIAEALDQFHQRHGAKIAARRAEIEAWDARHAAGDVPAAADGATPTNNDQADAAPAEADANAETYRHAPRVAERLDFFTAAGIYALSYRIEGQERLREKVLDVPLRDGETNLFDEDAIAVAAEFLGVPKDSIPAVTEK